MNTFKKPPLLLYSYLASEMLAPFFASFMIMNSVFFLVKLIPFLNFVLELEVSFVDFIKIFSYLFPNIFLYTIPMSAMIGVTLAFSRLSNDTEILALKAAGVSIYQMLLPVILVTLSLGLLTAYFSIKLIPVSEKNIEFFTYQLLKEKIDKGIKEKEFTEALGDIVVYVDDVNPETNIWQKVWVSDMRNQETPSITMAEHGRMKTDLGNFLITITLENGSLHRPDNVDSQIILFDKYKITIPLSAPGSKRKKLNRGTLTMTELLEMADIYGTETRPGKVFITEVHKRLVLPVGCVILALIGLPLGLQAGPGKKAIGIPFGLIVFISYYVMFTFAKIVSADTNFPIFIAMWLPNTFYLFFTIILIWRSANELPLIPEKMATIWSTLTERMMNYFNSLLVFRKKVQTQPITTFSSYDKLASRLFKKRTTIKANAKTRVFHLPECEFYDCKHCSIEFKNIEIAFQANFTPCKFCSNLISKRQNSQDDQS